MAVVAADGKVVGKIADLWVDRSEPRILYYEVALNDSVITDSDAPTEGTLLLPYGFARERFSEKRIYVSSIMSKHFQHVPRTASAEQVTRLEEDRICAYYASGHLYAHPSRQRPLI